MMEIFATYLMDVLLVMTMIYCIVLDYRIRVFRAQDGALRAIIRDLASATDHARMAMTQLKATLSDTQHAYSEQIEAAQQTTQQLARHVVEARELAQRVPLKADRQEMRPIDTSPTMAPRTFTPSAPAVSGRSAGFSNEVTDRNISTLRALAASLRRQMATIR